MRGGAVIDWEEHGRAFWVLEVFYTLIQVLAMSIDTLKSNEQYTSDLYLYVRMRIK